MAKAKFPLFLFFPCACGDGAMLCTCCSQLWEDKTLNTSTLPDGLNIRSLEGSKGSEINSAVGSGDLISLKEVNNSSCCGLLMVGGLCRGECRALKLHSLGKVPNICLSSPYIPFHVFLLLSPARRAQSWNFAFFHSRLELLLTVAAIGIGLFPAVQRLIK